MASAHNHVDDEMHELTQEADYLDQTVKVDPTPVNGHKAKRETGDHDPDAQAQVIDSLRSQIQDLFSQVSQLNNKLVKSYDRVSDLEDQLHLASDNLRNSTLKVSQLELEHAQHVSALSTGLLVEKSHVTTELTRLMEKATEEAARAGEAVSARNAIEKDLDDLSAGLFGQANIMVAEARLARARSERKVEETEEALRGAEEIVGVLQTQLQSLQAEKEESDRKAEEMRAFVGKGKWVERPHASGRAPGVRLLCLHAPYGEYLQLIAHLRSLRPSTPHPPAMSTLLPQPFLARLVAEDSDPTVRLDLAPQLNWLTRRSVISALYSGQLSVEPMSTTTLVEELTPSLIPGNHHTHISCAMCGTTIMEAPSSPSRPSFSPVRTASGGKTTWTPGLLKTSLVQSFTSASFGQNYSQPTTPTRSAFGPLAQVYIFRLENMSSSGLPIGGTPQQGAQARPPTIYPLCASGWCLTRLRTTCSLWAFIRMNVVEKVWEEESYGPSSKLGSPRRALTPDLHGDSAERPQAQSRPSRIGIGALWGSMSRSLSGPKTKSEPTPTGRAESPQIKEVHEESAKPGMNKSSPPMPPRRLPPLPPRNLPPPPPRNLPPPPPRHPPPEETAPKPSAAPAGSPPPLPKRNRQRAAEQAQGEEDSSAPAAIAGEHTEAPLAPASLSPKEGDSLAPATSIDDGIEVPNASLLSPPEEIEDFTTPEEELAAPPMDRAPTPTSVPLPESVPASPTQPEAPALPPAPSQSETTARPETPPSATSQPETVARSETPPPQSSDGKPPVPPRASARNSIGAPPPLPRRAAARARPMSISSPLATEVTKDDAETPKPEPKEDGADVQAPTAESLQEATLSDGAPAADQAPTDAGEHESAAAATEDDVKHESVSAIHEPHTDGEDAGSTNEKAGPASSTENLPSAGETNSLALKGHLDVPTPPAANSETASVAPSSVHHFESKEGSLEEVSLVNVSDTAPEETRVLDSPDNGSETVQSEVEDMGDPGIYVGNASWEERMWKELVKLREEMFWARIGGVR